MPHDCKGRLVERGDIVRGRGYNIKHDIIGPVLKVVESESCNVTVAVVGMTQPPIPADKAYGQHGFVHEGLVFHVGMEYGAAKDFEILKKHDGKLPVEAESLKSPVVGALGALGPMDAPGP